MQQQCETQANNPPTTVGSTGTKELVVATNGTTGKLNRITTVVQKIITSTARRRSNEERDS